MVKNVLRKINEFILPLTHLSIPDYIYKIYYQVLGPLWEKHRWFPVVCLATNPLPLPHILMIYFLMLNLGSVRSQQRLNLPRRVRIWYCMIIYRKSTYSSPLYFFSLKSRGGGLVLSPSKIRKKNWEKKNMKTLGVSAKYKIILCYDVLVSFWLDVFFYTFFCELLFLDGLYYVADVQRCFWSRKESLIRIIGYFRLGKGEYVPHRDRATPPPTKTRNNGKDTEKYEVAHHFGFFPWSNVFKHKQNINLQLLS